VLLAAVGKPATDPDLEQAQIIAAAKLVGADEITTEQLSGSELRRLAIKDGEAAFR
jgi:hypothetical protein